MPKVTVDGKQIDAGVGINLIEAAEHLGIEIPHYCYHPGLSIPGNCRMCLVEVEKIPKLQIACNTRVADGMVVHTNNPRVKAAQKSVLEFLLINHPIDCPVCDQAGECKLQDYYMDYDDESSRFELGRKNHKGKAIYVGSDVMLDQERCILCARCTRFFDEVTKTGELAIFNRGDHCEIDTYPGRPINNKYAGNVIDICPVGALTSKDFRFRMRVWYLHETPSVCFGCERGCAIDIDHHRGRIYRFKPRYNPEVNSYWMCDEGRYGFGVLQTESRATKALYRSADRLLPEPYPSAIRRAAAQIREYGEAGGANAIGALIGARATNEEIFALKRLIKEVIGSDHLGGFSFTPAGLSGDDKLLIRANKNPNTRGLIALGIGADGVDRLTPPIASGQLKLLIVLRCDLVRALGEADFLQRFGPLDYLVVLDTDLSETVQMANQMLPIAAYQELDGTFTNFQSHVQRLTKAYDPPGESMTAIEAIERLGHALDEVDRSKTADAVFADLAASEPAFAGMSFAALSDHGAKLAAGTMV